MRRARRGPNRAAGRDVAVEPGDDDADAPALAVRLPLEHGVSGWHGELARGMVHRRRDVICERPRRIVRRQRGLLAASGCGSAVLDRGSTAAGSTGSGSTRHRARPHRRVSGSGSAAGQPSRTFSLDASRSTSSTSARPARGGSPRRRSRRGRRRDGGSRARRPSGAFRTGRSFSQPSFAQELSGSKRTRWWCSGCPIV